MPIEWNKLSAEPSPQLKKHRHVSQEASTVVIGKPSLVFFSF